MVTNYNLSGERMSTEEFLTQVADKEFLGYSQGYKPGNESKEIYVIPTTEVIRFASELEEGELEAWERINTQRFIG